MEFIPSNFRDLLIKSGLSENEVIVYLELLKAPATTKWQIVERTGLNRNFVYRAFDRLEQLGLASNSKDSVKGLSVDGLVNELESSKKDLSSLVTELKSLSSFLDFDLQKNDSVQFFNDREKVIEAYIMMSEISYETCLDFGDLENFVPVLGGMDPVFKFRENRFNQRAKNWAICTTFGPYTQCMLRKQDMKRFKSSIDRVKIESRGKWIVFSDTNDYVLFNDFADQQNPSSVLVRSKVVADSQRMQFDHYAKNVDRM